MAKAPAETPIRRVAQSSTRIQSRAKRTIETEEVDIMAKCYNCGRGELVARKATIDYKQASLPYPVMLSGVPSKCCVACGEEAFSIPDTEGLHRTLSIHIVRVNRPLLHQEIRFLRKSLDWSAEHLAGVMGVDSKTMSRWENGRQKIGTVAERFLRLLVLQRLDEDAGAFTEEVLATLGRGPAEASGSLHLSASRAGWREAA